jgi:hypothetical protein
VQVHVHDNCFLDIFVVVGQDNTPIFKFLIAGSSKSSQSRTHRSYSVHAVTYFACGVNDPACNLLVPYDFYFSKLFENLFIACGFNDMHN